MPTPDEVKDPLAQIITNIKRNTFEECKCSFDEGVLLYRPEDNAFIALYGDEWLDIRLHALENITPIQELQEANTKATEKAVAWRELQQKPGVTKAELEAAQEELDTALNIVAQKSEAAKKKIEPIKTLGNDPNKLYELVPLTMKRIIYTKGGPEKRRLITPIFVRADKLKKVLADKRIYMVEGDAERKKRKEEKLFNGMRPNMTELKNRLTEHVQDKVQFSKKWKLAPEDADEYAGILGDWARTMGADATKFLERSQEELAKQYLKPETFDQNNPYRNIDLKSDAQLMRWAGGAGLETNFSPFQGSLFDKRDKDWKARVKRAAKSAQFGIKANAEASFAVGEAKVETVAYFPHYTGWEVSPSVLGQPFNFGYFRLSGDLLLYGLVGASIALEADIGLMLVGDKQGVKGTPKGQKGAKAKAGASAGIELFAGIKEGATLSGAMQWLNPEGVLGSGTPKKLKPNEAVAEYADIAKVSGTIEGIEGLSGKLGFECAYRNGMFKVVGEANLCLGLGGGGKVGAEVGVATIGDFFMCTCHILKQVDYKKMSEVMGEETFKVFNKILFLVEAGVDDLQSFATTKLIDIENMYSSAIDSLSRQGKEFLNRLQQRMRSGWGWFAYMPPESRGAILMAINDARLSAPADREVQLAAAFCAHQLLCTTQTSRHLDKTLERMSFAMGNQNDSRETKAMLTALFDDTHFAGSLEAVQSKLADAKPMIGRPFLRNDDPEFFAATLPFNSPIYSNKV